MILRELDTNVQSATWNITSDDVLLKMQAENPIPTLRFLSFERCVLAGYFQSINQEIRTDYCKENGIEINRRITGGGTIYFDPSQVGWEIIAPISLFGGNPTKLYEMFGKSVAEGLSTLGIKAEFKPRNDIEVGGKKISGMGGVTAGNAFLFQGTLLVADLIEEMLYSLRVPVEKLKPKEIDSVRERVTCIEHELGRIPSRVELKNAMKIGFEKVLGITTEESELTANELEKINESIPEFSSQKWINRINLPVDSQGLITGSFRSKNFGTIKINSLVNTKQKMLRSSIITGDFFLEQPEILFDLERLLKNIHMDEDKILGVIDEFLSSHPDLPVSDFKSAFGEIFKKLAWVKEGFTPTEANNLYAVNFKPGDPIKPTHFLFPYCAKGADCEFRFIDECPQCPECTVGDGYKIAIDAGLEPLTVTSFENLLEKFDYMKNAGATSYIGSCCEPFYVKHQEEFIASGLKGLLVNVKDSTCYDLGKAHKAYAGTFENQTNLELGLVRKVVGWVFSSK